MNEEAAGPEISVVIPIHNEEANIRPLYDELNTALAAYGRPYELIFVNDGSVDGSLEQLKALPRATVLDLTRRYGQATALNVGFRHAKGDIIVSIDGDCQNDPADIPMLIDELEGKGLDMVAGWRTNRMDPRRSIKFITRAGRSLRRAVLNDRISDSGCALRAYRRHAVESLDLQGEMQRYIPALLLWKGYCVGELPINDRPRTSGVSKYGYDKAVRAFIDLLYLWFLHKYSQRPLHLFGYLSLTSFALFLGSFVITAYDKLELGLHLNRNGWFFLTFFFLIMAIMLFSFGIIIDLLMRIYHNGSQYEKRYYIRATHVNG